MQTRRFLAGTLITVVSLAVSLFVADRIAARLPLDTAPPEEKSVFRGELPLHALRFRDFTYPTEKLPGRFRILGVGDSFTRGDGVAFDDTWAKRLERHLNFFEQPPVYEVMNFGIDGTSTPDHLVMIRREAPALRPDLVIVGYCLNDAEDRSRSDELVKMGRRLHVGFSRKPEGTDGLLYRHSALARLIIHRLHNYRSFRGQVRYYRNLYRESYSGWQRARQALFGLGEFSRSSGVPVVVMIFPLFSWGLDEDYPFESVHVRLRHVLAEAGVPFLDLLRSFRGRDRMRLEASPYHDPHPSEIAHRIASDALWTFLHEKDLVPGPGLPDTIAGATGIRVPFPWPTPARAAGGS